jgi:hypothetical protein
VLTDPDRALLAFEKLRWNHQGAKANAVHDVFGLTLTAYLQRINTLIDRPEALEAEPALVLRLQRLRSTRRARAGRT